MRYYWNQQTNVTSWARPAGHAVTRPNPPNLSAEVQDREEEEGRARRRMFELSVAQTRDPLERHGKALQFTQQERRCRAAGQRAVGLQFLAQTEDYKERRRKFKLNFKFENIILDSILTFCC